MKLLFRHTILFCLLSAATAFRSSGQVIKDLNDGPYIFSIEDKLVARWVEDGFSHRKVITKKNFNDFRDKFGLKCSIRDLYVPYSRKSSFKQVYKGVDSICAISDIHGEYKKYLELLKTQNIIDYNLNWKFGTGHLVVLGDYFDRGEHVTELLWHLFGLEKQAEKAGGKVHVMIGNHEMMMFSKDDRYMNDKYRKVEQVLEMHYVDLFSGGSVLGEWLRSKPVIVQINDNLFVHGGISSELVQRQMKPEQINKLFYQLTTGQNLASDEELKDILFLSDDKGPLWYRGFLTEPEFSEEMTDEILRFYGRSHIIVGHTTDNDVKALFHNKIICIDAGLGNDLPGAVLICKGNVFYKGTVDGKRTKL
jgi:hypothetical protein